MAEENNTVVLRDGRKLGYAVYGDTNGKPLFFFHGWPGSRLRGEGLDETAKSLHIRIISVDRPGFGLSDFQPDRTLLDWPDDVAELADILKIKKFSVVGVSGGGPYVAACAFKIPQRIDKAGIVVGLGPTDFKGAFDGVAFIGRIGWENYRRLPFIKYFSSLIWFTIIRFLPFLATLTYMSSSDKKSLNRKTITQIKDSLRQAFRQGIRGPTHDLTIYTSLWNFSVNDIEKKVYLWYGNGDRNVSLNMGKYYADNLPDSDFTVYENEGHMVLNNHKKEILQKLI